ncbi:hypothetical protein SNEBB_007341 [Seison nebaliae]|nr:hypothetical protein SNEBB_007341 [Seison nebaliae]
MLTPPEEDRLVANRYFIVNFQQTWTGVKQVSLDRTRVDNYTIIGLTNIREERHTRYYSVNDRIVDNIADSYWRI